jgi:excisionase family DNA binding protein
LLTVREVAEALRVSTMTVYRLIRAGELASTRVGKGYRIRAGDLDRYLRPDGLTPGAGNLDAP